MDWTHQPSLSMDFSRQEYWSELSFSSPGIFLTQGWNWVSCVACKAIYVYVCVCVCVCIHIYVCLFVYTAALLTITEIMGTTYLSNRWMDNKIVRLLPLSQLLLIMLQWTLKCLYIFDLLFLFSLDIYLEELLDIQ